MAGTLPGSVELPRAAVRALRRRALRRRALRRRGRRAGALPEGMLFKEGMLLRGHLEHAAALLLELLLGTVPPLALLLVLLRPPLALLRLPGEIPA